MATQILFIFTTKIGENSHFDKHIFQMGLKPPTSCCLEKMSHFDVTFFFWRIKGDKTPVL